MIAAVEKVKFVYILNRENDKITISSPLDSNKSHTIIYDIAAKDVGLENSEFVSIEIDFGDIDDKEAPIYTG